MKNLRSLNLNLLPVLRELLRQRNVTHAAKALNMSQPAVSEALGKIRHMFQDELLVQDKRGLVLTAVAERLNPLLDDALSQIEHLVGATYFDPATATGTIRIAAADYVVLLLGTKLVSWLREAAPGVTIQFQELNTGVDDALRRGLLDFMLIPEVTTNSTLVDCERAVLFEDDIVCLVDSRSPVGDRVDEKTYAAARHVFFSPRSDVYAPVRATVLQQMGDQRRDSALVASYLLLPFLVEGTDVIALIQRRLALKLLPAAAVRIAEPPFPLPKMRIHALWMRGRTRDPLHKWFREAMFKVAQAELSTAAEPL